MSNKSTQSRRRKAICLHVTFIELHRTLFCPLSIIKEIDFYMNILKCIPYSRINSNDAIYLNRALQKTAGRRAKSVDFTYACGQG